MYFVQLSQIRFWRLRWCCFRYGDDCALNCKKGYESYHWCWKSYHDSQVAFDLFLWYQYCAIIIGSKTTFLFNQIHMIACFLRTGSTVDLTAKHVTVLAAYRSALKTERIIGEEWLSFSAIKLMRKASLIIHTFNLFNVPLLSWCCPCPGGVTQSILAVCFLQNGNTALLLVRSGHKQAKAHMYMCLVCNILHWISRWLQRRWHTLSMARSAWATVEHMARNTGFTIMMMGS